MKKRWGLRPLVVEAGAGKMMSQMAGESAGVVDGDENSRRLGGGGRGGL